MQHLEKLFKGGNVKRYHTETLIGHQKVSEHSWGVAVIIDRLWPNASKTLILAAIYHDIAEGEFGDIPSPTKRALDSEVLDEWEGRFHKETNTEHMYALEPIEQAQLKIADYLELVLFCQHQRRIGNSFLNNCEAKTTGYIKEVLSNHIYPDVAIIKTMAPGGYDWVSEILRSSII